MLLNVSDKVTGNVICIYEFFKRECCPEKYNKIVNNTLQINAEICDKPLLVISYKL